MAFSSDVISVEKNNHIGTVWLNRPEKYNALSEQVWLDIPDALENNFNLPLRCNYRPTTSKPLLPNIGSKETFTADDIIKKEAEKGIDQYFFSGNINPRNIQIRSWPLF